MITKTQIKIGILTIASIFGYKFIDEYIKYAGWDWKALAFITIGLFGAYWVISK